MSLSIRPRVQFLSPRIHLVDLNSKIFAIPLSSSKERREQQLSHNDQISYSAADTACFVEAIGKIVPGTKAKASASASANCALVGLLTCVPSLKVQQPSRNNALAGFVKARSERTITTNELPDPREEKQVRLPRAVQALYLQPLRREAPYGVPTCDLQLRSFSIPNLEFFCDFALRAAYYLNLPAFGPIPLPRITERWTVPKSHFIFKKSQENFERVTRRRLIQIRDGHPETVQIWLAYLQKHAYYGIGMKANLWEFSSLDPGKVMDAEEKSLQQIVEKKLESFGRNGTLGTVEKVKELLQSERFRRT
ncbi:mitochondrial 37S ribosomal protein rsm10 [Parahypoxylon ruwenzoriense]